MGAVPPQHVVSLGLPPRYPGCLTGHKMLFFSAVVLQNEGCILKSPNRGCVGPVCGLGF